MKQEAAYPAGHQLSRCAITEQTIAKTAGSDHPSAATHLFVTSRQPTILRRHRRRTAASIAGIS